MKPKNKRLKRPKSLDRRTKEYKQGLPSLKPLPGIQYSSIEYKIPIPGLGEINIKVN